LITVGNERRACSRSSGRQWRPPSD